ncbi:MAG: SPOR domain-containing protein [Pseudomonadota bacterium]
MRDDAEFEAAAGEDLPWLEPAELSYAETGGGGFLTRRTIIIAGVTIAVLVAILWWVADAMGGGEIEIPETGELPLVTAPEGPYRVAPKDPGGMELPKDELGMHAVAEGQALPGDVATDALPEVPVPVVPPVGTGAADGPPRDLIDEAREAREESEAQDAAAVSAPPAAIVETPPPSPAGLPEPVPPVPSGPAFIQLGAFSTPAKANAAWDTLSGRYPYVAALPKSVEAVAINDTTLYRLRATGLDDRAAANDLCARLKLAGETCTVPR